ncbi:hypothetical protein MRX96_030975 [Rhipicephalus microplus]
MAEVWLEAKPRSGVSPLSGRQRKCGPRRPAASRGSSVGRKRGGNPLPLPWSQGRAGLEPGAAEQPASPMTHFSAGPRFVPLTGGVCLTVRVLSAPRRRNKNSDARAGRRGGRPFARPETSRRISSGGSRDARPGRSKDVGARLPNEPRSEKSTDSGVKALAA